MAKTRAALENNITMPAVAAVSKIHFPFEVDQQEVKQYAKELFAPSFPQVERMMGTFDNTEIETRNFCKTLDYYSTLHTFQENNAEYIRISLEYSVKAVEECLFSARIQKNKIKRRITMTCFKL